MVAKIIDGRAVAAKVVARVRERAQALRARGVESCLAIVLVGDDPISHRLVERKCAVCRDAGILARFIPLPETAAQQELVALIDELNADASVHGVLCQLPFPGHINEKTVMQRIAREKDVDAFSALIGGDRDDMAACTPAGVIELLDSEGIVIAGKSCVVVGRSAIVGKPMAMQLMLRDGTVTVCHTKTRDLPDITVRADILVVAAGSPRLVTADMVKEGAAVIDVGNNRDLNGVLCGDVDFDAVREKASHITPVPGGVGPMTVAMLMQNTITAAEKQAAGA
ncbi:MAG TPA: tetrahydrofolate dehydrogenase/cyclohydrolase catalytic domain-containing protein [Clostridia bacterium]|nr:tetrahydrofolate dehydrogenase/cyclohydrolase catalytic domain-containing protein [Clostridia bacterium]